MKRFFKLLLIIIMFFAFLNAEASTLTTARNYCQKGLKAYEKENFTSAIEYYSKALKLQPQNKTIAMNLAKCHGILGANYVGKNKEYGKAAIEYRTSLYYMLYFNGGVDIKENEDAIQATNTVLNDCLKKIHFKKSAKNRYYTAKLLDLAEIYPASAYEYIQASKSKKYKEIAEKRAKEIETLISSEKTRTKNENKNNSTRKD